MNIRLRLTIQFALIVTAILLLFTISIYYLSEYYRENDFYDRLKLRALTTAKLLIEVKEVDVPLMKIIDKNSFTLDDQTIRVYNFRNEMIYNSSDRDTGFYSNNFLNEIRLNSDVRKTIGKKQILGLSYTQYPRKYVVIASAIDTMGYEEMDNLRLILIIGFLSSILLTILLGAFYAGRALKPITDIISKVGKITISNLHLRLTTGNDKDEIARLAITFNEMLSRIEASFETQKNFVSNASHEFRTPFAILLNEIEFALKKERSNREYIEALNSIAQEIKNLHNLSENLLELTRASLDVSAFSFSPLRLDDAILQTRAVVLKSKPDYSVEIDFNELPDDESLITIPGNEQLLSLAFYNLVNNACKFSDTHKVKISLKNRSEMIIIQFSDNGIGIPENELKDVFEPFFRGSNVKGEIGHGLGLPLVKKIIELHNGKISVSSTVNKGSVFSVSFSS